MPKYKITMSEPDLRGKEREYLSECITSNWISSAGPFVVEFEDAISQLFNRKFAVSTSSGTSSLQLALQASGISIGDLVVIPDWTFSGTINAVINAGATPVLCDIDPLTYGICFESFCSLLKKQKKDGKKIKAVLPVHPMGLPLNLSDFYQLADKNGFTIVEDAAGAFGSEMNGTKVGSTGSAVVFSFNGNKVLTSGGGGMVLTDNDLIAQNIKLLRTNSSGVYEYLTPAYNHQMLNIAAAIGLAQLERTGAMITRRKEIHQAYMANLPQAHDFFSLPEIQSSIRYNYWMFWLKFNSADLATNFVSYMSELGIQTRVFWGSLSLSQAFRRFKTSGLKHSHSVSGCVVAIPSSSNLTDQNQNQVILSIADWVKRN